MTIERTCNNILAAHCARALRSPSPSSKAEGAGKTGWPLHPGLPRKRHLRERENHRYRRDHPGLPCAVVYGLYELSSVNQRLPPSSARDLWSLARTWRLHGRARTTRLRRPQPCRMSIGMIPSTAFRSTFVTTRTPLVSVRNAGIKAQLPKKRKLNIFAAGTGQSGLASKRSSEAICPSGGKRIQF